ncbi:MAG TPA: MBL fold metallo-hydrolase [Actinomycetes bacterium]|nr:MBL fold metallo-hydrolase [Actinomycetes bacterium]
MTYTGQVTPGGPPDVRELDALTITKVSVGPMDNNAYLLGCRASGELLLVDAANDAQTLLGLIGDRELERVVTTHQHKDHWVALEAVVDATGARTAAGVDDAPGIPVPTREPLKDGDRVYVGEVGLSVIHLVGHTPGSVALLYEDPTGHPHLFTGDSLFPGGVGKTSGPETFGSLIDDVEHKLFARLPDETWFYPGHGNDSSLGAERPALPEWRARGW